MAPARTECVSPTGDPAIATRFERDVIPLIESLRRRAIRFTSTPADAEDLLQETLLKAYAGRHSFQQGTNLSAWLFGLQNDGIPAWICCGTVLLAGWVLRLGGIDHEGTKDAKISN